MREIAEDWDRLLQRIARPQFFHQREWFESYLEALEQNPDDALFLAIFDGADLEAIVPLKQERRAIAGPIKLRTLELPRHDHLHLRDIIVSDLASRSLSLTAIVNLLKKCREVKWDILALWHCLEDSCAISAHKLDAPKSSICRPRFACSHLEIEPWEDMQKKLSKSFRQNLRTANNRAKGMEGLRIETINTLSELESALAAFIEVEASGWKASTGTAIKQNESLKSFYAHVVRRFAQNDACEIHLLRQNGKPAAGLLTLFAGDRVYIPKVGYDEEFSRISPVQLLLEHAFKQWGERDGLKELNLTSDAGWFDVWKPQKSTVSNIYIFNRTPLGIAAGIGMRAAEKMKRKEPQNPPAGEKPAA